MKIGKPEYIEKAKSLSYDEQQRILSRMTGKLPKRLIKEKLSVDEAIAIQLEIEEEQLQEWRNNWEKIKKQGVKTAQKAPAKAMSSKSITKTAAAKPVMKKTAIQAPAEKPTATAKPTAAVKKPATAKPLMEKAATAKARKPTT